MKNDGRLGRNYLLDKDGDRVNVILCACGQNLRLLLNHIRKGGSFSYILSVVGDGFLSIDCPFAHRTGQKRHQRTGT